MKKSKLQRKFVNSMDSMADVPKSPRRFHYPPTFNVVGAARETHIGHCKRPVGEQTVRRGKLRRKKTEQVACGGRVFLRRSRNGRRRVYCESCRERKAQLRVIRQLEQRMRRFGAVSPQQQARDDRRAVRMLQRFRRAGAR